MELNSSSTQRVKGRGAQVNPANRFEYREYKIEFPEAVDDWERNRIHTRIYEEKGKSILNKITSPDIPLTWSLNPYQGCEHGCVYCYARNSHEFWGFSAGTDFESQLIVKRKAPELLRTLFSSKSWKVAPISLSGNTDCYQPIEKKLNITRRILEVCLEYRNPVGIITKNALILRDLDILKALNEHKLVNVFVSITSTDEKLRRSLEPRTSTYSERFKTLETLSKAGIPCGVMNAPIIPGLNDTHMYNVLRQAAQTGARFAGYTLVRLNGAVEAIFKDWVYKTWPEKADRIIHSIEEVHGGQVHDSRFFTRMKGEGPLARILADQFKLFCKQFGLNQEAFAYNLEAFVRHKPGQLSLF